MATATMSRSETRKMYSWWWDSHISPKNSKWLQENLTDMDSKVKSMIKIIEVDEDTFARRAEMYYKKRPELMKLVEEFYRAYRALAERYDHATGVIREAHTTMAEAFPNQVPFGMNDDGPVNSTHNSGPHTPELRPSNQAISDLDELHKYALGLSSSDFLSGKPNGDFTNGSDLPFSRKEPKQLNGLGKARKGLNFQETEKNQIETRVLTESERLGKSESDIQDLKESLAKLVAEKETGIAEYEKTVERLSKLESDFSQAKLDSQGLNERSNKAEAEVQSLKEFLANVETEREASLTQYQQYLDKIAVLESQISRAVENAGQQNDQKCISENVVSDLMEELTQLKAEKEALLAKYMEALEKLANLENKILLAEDFASRITERAEKAEKEADTLKEIITRLTEEKEDAVLKYEHSLEKITTLENEISLIQEEAEKSNKSLEEKLDLQNQELSEKHKELGRLWTCVQEERLRFMDAEAGFKSLQNLHLKVQEELSSVADELQKKVQLLKELENKKQQLEDEVQKVKDENRNLDEMNLSSVVSMKIMREEILGLKDGKANLEKELEVHLDQRNALQEEIGCLKQELNSLSERHQYLSMQVESVGFDPESFDSSVKGLQEENSKLKENFQRSTNEISGLVERLGVMERLVEKNDVLESSLSDLGAELEGAREKVKELEESCELLMGENSALGTEKGTLISQLQMTTENLEKVSQRNTRLQNLLFDVNAELEMLRLKSENLEDSCKVLSDRNSVLITEKQILASELDRTHNKLVDLGRRHTDLEERYSILEEERKSTLQKVEVLQIYLASEKQDHANSQKLSQTQIAELEKRVHLLQEEGDHMKGEFEEELDNAINAQFEIFILRKCIQDLKDNNFSLLRYCEKLLEVSKLSEKIVSELEKQNVTHHDEVKGLRAGMFQLLDTLEAEIELSSDEYNNEDKKFIDLIRVKLDDMKLSLFGAFDENRELVVQKSILVEVISQLKQDVSDLTSVIYTFKQEIGRRNAEVIVQQKESQKLLESNEELILKVREGNMREAILLTQVENLQEKLSNLQKAYEDLQNENLRIVEGNKSLIFTIEDLEEEKRYLEDEFSCMVAEVVELDNLSFIFKNVISEKSKNVTALTQTIDKLSSDNNILEEKVRSIERNLEDARTELSLKKSENELEEVLVAKMQISKMQKEHEESEAKLRVLSSELQKGKDEIKLWETVAGTFFSELQSSGLREALIKEKFAEIIKAYDTLEDESYMKCMDVAHLRARVEELEGENSEIKARLTADLSAIMSLNDSVASLEKHAMSLKKIQQGDNGDKEDFENSQNSNETQSGGFVDLHEVQARIQDVEKAIIELKQNSEEKYAGVRSDLNTALQQIVALKTQRSLRRSGRLSSRASSRSGEELVMKDIVLDQDHSPYGKNRQDNALELCETIDRSCNVIDLTVGRHRRSRKDIRHPSSESLVERELGVDEQSSSKSFRNPLVEDNKKILERMASDVQKLTNLQITVQDLKEKFEIPESGPSSKGKVIERDNMKEQLVESEQTILKLLDFSAKVMKNFENSASTSSSMSSFDGIPSVDDLDRSARRNKSMDQARKISEKIGRLQLEVQKVQFFLMKQANNKVGKGGTRIPEKSTRVLLRDYLYGGTRTPRRRTKTPFCGCVQPDTKG